ncbi:hypothetical protein PGB90_007598 [Kerria lacca]
MTSENSSTDTDNNSIECFQNYTASEVFIQGLAGLIDQQDVESMIRAQKQILQRFEKTNEMLSNCNNLSVSRLKIAGQQFKNYKQLILDIKKDLDYTFKKINILKNKLQLQYPQSVAATTSKSVTFEEEPKNNENSAEHSTNNIKLNELKNEEYEESDTVNIFVVEEKSLCIQMDKKVEISDSNSSESGEADSHIESNSISNSDTA